MSGANNDPMTIRGVVFVGVRLRLLFLKNWKIIRTVRARHSTQCKERICERIQIPQRAVVLRMKKEEGSQEFSF